MRRITRRLTGIYNVIEGDLAVYSIGELEQYFKNVGFDFKKGYELIAGCVIAKRLEEDTGKIRGVGFEVTAEYRQANGSRRPDIGYSIEHDYYIVDRDVDIWIVDDHNNRNKYQITRLDSRAKGKTPSERLRNLLNKKMRIQPDSYLQLIVLLDEQFDLDFDEIKSHLESLEPIPYVRIGLIVQHSDDPKRRPFLCFEIYPDVIRDEREVYLDIY